LLPVEWLFAYVLHFDVLQCEVLDASAGATPALSNAHVVSMLTTVLFVLVNSRAPVGFDL